MDRNRSNGVAEGARPPSLSARRAWIEIGKVRSKTFPGIVALRKESVDRNPNRVYKGRNFRLSLSARRAWIEIIIWCCSVCKDRSLSARRAWIEMTLAAGCRPAHPVSLSARRAWIEIGQLLLMNFPTMVALRKESVDRNWDGFYFCHPSLQSLSARRAWIEMRPADCYCWVAPTVALRKESVDRNPESGAMGITIKVALRKESVDRN